MIGGGDTEQTVSAHPFATGAKAWLTLNCCRNLPRNVPSDNPWPEWPRVFRTDYGHEEAAEKFGKDPRTYCILSKEFIDDGQGNVAGIKTVGVEWTKNDQGGWEMSEVPGSEKEWPAQRIFLAMGFLGPEQYLVDSLGLETDGRSNYKAEHGRFATSIEGVFAAGDCRRGQSLVVWAINEGRGAARAIDIFLEGSSTLPAPGVTMGTQLAGS